MPNKQNICALNYMRGNATLCCKVQVGYIWFSALCLRKMVELWRLLYVCHLEIVGFDCGGKKILLWGWFEGFIEKREVVGWQKFYTMQIIFQHWRVVYILDSKIDPFLSYWFSWRLYKLVTFWVLIKLLPVELWFYIHKCRINNRHWKLNHQN